MAPHAILVGHDPALLALRAFMLQRAQFTIGIVNMNSLRKYEHLSHVGLVVLCHTLSVEEQASAYGFITLHSPSVRIISMTKSYEEERFVAGVQISATEGPHALVDLCCKLITNCGMRKDPTALMLVSRPLSSACPFCRIKTMVIKHWSRFIQKALR
jgi:hypothetical protein